MEEVILKLVKGRMLNDEVCNSIINAYNVSFDDFVVKLAETIKDNKIKQEYIKSVNAKNDEDIPF